MVFWQTDNLALEPFRPGVMSRAVLGENLIMVCMQLDPNMEDPGHTHPFDQCGTVIEGSIEMFVGKGRQVLGPRDTYFVPAGVRHGWKTFERPVRLLDICPKQSAG